MKILKDRGLLDIDLADFELHFDRGETVNVQAKAQSFNTMLASGLHPILAAAKSGISSDPVADIAMSEKYLKMVWGDPDAPEVEPGMESVAAEAPADAPDSDCKIRDPERDAEDRKRKANQKQQGDAWISGYWQRRGDR